VEAAQESGLAGALVERLVLNSKGVQAMAQGLREIAAQKDPVGEVIETDPAQRNNDRKVRVPRA